MTVDFFSTNINFQSTVSTDSFSYTLPPKGGKENQQNPKELFFLSVLLKFWLCLHVQTSQIPAKSCQWLATGQGHGWPMLVL